MRSRGGVIGEGIKGRSGLDRGKGGVGLAGVVPQGGGRVSAEQELWTRSNGEPLDMLLSKDVQMFPSRIATG